MSKDDRELIERLKKSAETSSRISREMAEAKSLRQGDCDPPRADLYACTKPEDTLEGQAATRLEALQAQPVGEEGVVWAREVTARYFENDPLDKGRREIAQHTREGRYDDQDAVQIALHTLAALTASPPVVEREALREIINRRVCGFVGEYENDREELIDAILALTPVEGVGERALRDAVVDLLAIVKGDLSGPAQVSGVISEAEAILAALSTPVAQGDEVRDALEGLRVIVPYLDWTISSESPGHHPTMPSAVAEFKTALATLTKGARDAG